MRTRFRPFALALCALLVLAPAALAGSGSGYWRGFLEYWEGVFQKQNGVVMGILAVGAVALFIITRGKWQK